MIAYISFPLYKWICKYVKSESWSALIMATIILVLITLPIIFIMNALISQTEVAYTLSRRVIVTGDLFYGDCVGKDTMLCNVVTPVQDLIANPRTKFYLEDGLKKITTTIIDKATNFIFAIPMRILDIFIMLFAIYYLLKDGPALVARIKKVLPICSGTCNILVHRMKGVFNAMIYGYFMIALMQGVLGGIGFLVVGISSPILWGLVMAIAALLPVFGTALVWFPASLFLILNGFFENSPLGIWKGIGLLIYGLLIVSTIDNFLRPKIVSKKADIHPVVVLIGVFGGLSVFGFIGLLIGPIILIVIITLIGMYEQLILSGNKVVDVKARKK